MRVITDREDAARDLRDLLGIPEERIEAVHLGVYVHPQSRPTPEPELRAQLGLDECPVILCVAQKRPHKNQEVLVRALTDERLALAHLVLPGAPAPYEEEH